MDNLSSLTSSKKIENTQQTQNQILTIDDIKQIVNISF